MNEAETRAEHIDPALKAAGWGVAEGSKILREYPITLGRIEGHGRRGKPLIADYVLVYRNRKLAVIEAKAWGKAGKTRWMGRRPKVRGEVMNPVDHPHGGRTRGGRNVVSPWGKKEGVKTRNKKKPSQRLIVRGRKRGKATQ